MGLINFNLNLILKYNINDIKSSQKEKQKIELFKYF